MRRPILILAAVFVWLPMHLRNMSRVEELRERIGWMDFRRGFDKCMELVIHDADDHRLRVCERMAREYFGEGRK